MMRHPYDPEEVDARAVRAENEAAEEARAADRARAAAPTPLCGPIADALRCASRYGYVHPSEERARARVAVFGTFADARYFACAYAHGFPAWRVEQQGPCRFVVRLCPDGPLANGEGKPAEGTT